MIDHGEIARVLKALFVSTHPVEVPDEKFRESTVALWTAVLNCADPGIMAQPEVLWATLVAEANQFLTHCSLAAGFGAYGGIDP